MKLVLNEPKYLREPIIIISELVNEVRFKLDKDKIELIAMDPANVAMVIFNLLGSAFTEYDIDHEMELAVNLDNLKQILKRTKPNDILTLELDESKNRLKVQIKGENTKTFHLALIDIEEKEQKIPDLKFPIKIKMPTIVFNEAIEDMDIISESVSLFAEPKKFVIQAMGTTSEGKVEFDDIKTSLTGNEKIKAKYSIEYLKKIMKGSKLADELVLQFNKDYPLRIDYTIKDKLQLSTILAPRVSDEE